MRRRRPSNGPAVEGRWPLAAEETREESGPGFAEREILWQGRRYKVIHRWQTAEYSAEVLMGLQIASISAVMKDAGDTGVGERCLSAMGRNYLFQWLGQVFYVYALEPEQSALELARAIDRALLDNN